MGVLPRLTIPTIGSFELRRTMSDVAGSSTMPTTAAATLARHLNSSISAPSKNTPLRYSPRSLLSLPLRAFQYAESFAFGTVPRQIARMAGIDDFRLNIWGGTAPVVGEAGLTSDAVAAASQAAMGTAGEAAAQAARQGDGWYTAEFMRTMRMVGGFFGYLTSIWSFACLVEASPVFLRFHEPC